MGLEIDDPHLIVRATHGTSAQLGLERLDRLLSINGEQVFTLHTNDACENIMQFSAGVIVVVLNYQYVFSYNLRECEHF